MKQNFKFNFWIILPIILIVLIISVIGFYIYHFYFKLSYSLSTEAGTWGTFGDYIGGLLNPIFAFASFMALLYTIKLQSEELKATREELARSAKAQEHSEKALAEQSQIFHQQQFEATFFSLLEQINKVADKIISDVNHHNQSRKQSTNDYYKMFNSKEFNEILQIIDTEPEWSHFKQYALLIYQTLKFVNSYGNSYEFKKKYTNILRASIPYQFLQLLAINAVRERESFYNYKRLIIKYEFLEHMPFQFDTNKVSTNFIVSHGKYTNTSECLKSLIDKYDRNSDSTKCKKSAFGKSDYVDYITRGNILSKPGMAEYMKQSFNKFEKKK